MHVSSTYVTVPYAAVAAGIPLNVRRQGESDPELAEGYAIGHFMSDPQVGLARPAWRFGGMLPPAPPCLLFRTDGIPFADDDWHLLDAFEMAMLDDGPRTVTRADCAAWVAQKTRTPRNPAAPDDTTPKLLQAPCLPRPPLVLAVEYRAGDRVRISGLTGAPELNGITATVKRGRGCPADRVGVYVPGVGVKALKEGNLQRCAVMPAVSNACAV